MCNDNSSGSSNPVADDASKSLNSFVMDRMRHKALQKWQTNSSRTLNTAASKEAENECRVIAFDTNDEKDCDMSSCGDDATAALGMEDFSGRRDSFFDDWLDVDEPVVDIPRPAPLKNKAKTTGRSLSPVPVPRPTSKTHLRRVKSDERFAKPHGVSSNKNKMRKVVSDADKARFKMPNSSVLDDDAWCGGPSVRDLSKLCINKESTRVTGLPTASRSLSPPKNKETDKEEATNKLRRAVSDLGKKAPASPRCSTSSTSSTSKADRRRLIKDSVSNLAGTKSSDASDAIRAPSISDIRSMIDSCHGDPQRTSRSSSSTRKKKTLTRCRSENDPRDALASKSCHSRLTSSSSKSRSQSPQSKNKHKLSSSSCHNRLTPASKSKPSGSKSTSRSSTPPPDFRWDHYKVNSQAA